MTAYILKSKSITHKQEDRSLQILGNLFDLSKIEIEHEGGVVVSFDGDISFLDCKGGPAVVTMNQIPSLATGRYQVKSTGDPKKKSQKLDIEDITSYVLRAPYRAIVFLVNIPLETVYWEIIDKNYTTSVLGIKDLENPRCKTKTINFKKEKIFDKSKADALFQDFVNPDTYSVSPSHVPGKDVDQNATPEEIKKYKISLNTIITKDLEKILILEALIFYNSPLILTKNDVLQSIVSKSELTMVEFEFYIKKLTEEGIVTRVGDVVSITDTKVAKSLLQELIDKKGVEYLYG